MATKTKIVKFEREFVVFDEQALRAFFLSQGFVDEMISYRLAPDQNVPQPVEHHIVMIGVRSDHPDNADDPEAKRRGYYYYGDCASVTEVLDSLPTQAKCYCDDSEELDSEPTQAESRDDRLKRLSAEAAAFGFTITPQQIKDQLARELARENRQTVYRIIVVLFAASAALIVAGTAFMRVFG